MRFRETGSIRLDAPRERVHEVLSRRLGTEPGVTATPDRLEAKRSTGESTFILREDRGGTRVILARTERAPLMLLPKPRAELRQEVEAELFKLQRLVDAWSTKRSE